MRTLRCLALLALTVLPVAAQDGPLPPPARTPVLRLAPDGPAAPTAAAAFAPDGSALYVGGFDKLVRVYALRGGRFVEAAPLRVPVGPGNAGAVNAVAVSPDGKWVAVAGRAPMRDEAAFGQEGVVVETKGLPDVMRRDLGVIYLFAANNPAGGKVLRGHKGEVRALAFASPSPAGGPVLVSAGLERGDDGKVGVVRVWNLATGTELASGAAFPATETAPGLAAWPTGGGAKNLRIVVAWPEPDAAGKPVAGNLVDWDVAANAVYRLPDGTHNRSLVVRPGAGGAPEIVTGGYRDGAGGRLTVRQSADRAEIGLIPFPAQDGWFYLPRAVASVGRDLAVLLDAAKRTGDATVRRTELRLLGAGRQVELTGVDHERGSFLAASADGRLLAVGGFADHRVEVFDVAALTAGREARQVLPGSAEGFASVTFLAGNKLWLGGTADAPDRGGIVFDFATRTVTTNGGRPQLDAPAPATITLDSARHTATIQVGGQTSTFTVRASEVPTAAAYLPAAPPWKKSLGPVAAVAHADPANAVTLVTLFDAATGKRLRQLVGPERPVRALAFSASRPLLAAVSGDGTATVWSLKDLDRETGVVEGVHVTDGAKGVTVANIEPGSPAEKLLAVGNVIEGVKSAADFRWEVRSRPVGGTLAVRVAGKPQPVALPVGRGVEQRGPLFTLWVGPGARPADRPWVGWSPAGVYDASSPAAEARIGWLTATGDPAAPTTYAGADQYRKQYYRRDALRFLVEKAELAAAVDAWLDEYPPPPPGLRLQIAGAVAQAAGVLVLREKKAVLRVDLTDLTDEFPMDRAVLAWRTTGPDAPPGEWQRVPLAGKDWPMEVDLSALPWGRGRRSFEVALHRTATSPAGATAVAEVAFVPRAPAVTALVGGRPVKGEKVTVEGDAASVAAKVEPADADVSVTWTDPAGKEQTAELRGANGTFGPVELKLAAGVTTVRLKATARGSGEFAAMETSEAPPLLLDKPAPPQVVLPPRVGRPEVAGGVPERAVQVVGMPTVRVTAALESAEPITAVEWDDGDGKWVSVPPDARTTSREVKLPVGTPRTVRVRAKSAKSEYGAAAVEVAYHPPLPDARLAELAAAAVTNPEVALKGTLTGGAAGVPVRLAVTVGAKEFPAAVDATAGTWTATVALAPGTNRLGLVVRNDWRVDARPDLAALTYRRPPKLVRVKPVDAGEKAVADVVATVSAAEGVDPRVLLVNGRPVETSPPKKLPTGDWEVTAPGVPVKVGGEWLDTLRVAARNDDGDSAAVPVTVKRTEVRLRPPVVALADGAEVRTTDEPVLTVAFKVTSDTPLARVEVEQAAANGGFERAGAADPATAVRVGAGFALTAGVRAELREGPNRFRVTAVNPGGKTESAVFTVSRTPAATRVVIDAVEELDRGGGVIRTLGRSGDAFAEAGGGFVRVVGRVRWPADGPRDPNPTLVLYANEVGHLPVQLGPPAGREQVFRAPVFLNAADTHVRVELRTGARGPAKPQAAGADFRVRCKAPLTRQRLHVVVVGVDVPPQDRFALAKTVVESVGGAVPAGKAGRFDRGEFAAPAFARAVLYPAVVGEVDAGNVGWVLDEVGRELARLGTEAPDTWVNDVILLYYQGEDWVGPDGRRWVHTSRSKRYAEAAAARFAVPVDGLPTTPGVRLVLLNVVNARPGRPADPLATGLQLLRYVWKDPAAAGHLFPALAEAVAEKPTLGGVVDLVRAKVEADPGRGGEPIERLTTELRQRTIGVGRP